MDESKENSTDVDMVDLSSCVSLDDAEKIDNPTGMVDESADKVDEKEPVIGIDLGTTYCCVYV